MQQREYNLTLAQLIDLLSIITLKSVKLSHKDEYEKEAQEIMKDIDAILKKTKINDFGKFVRAIQVDMLANELIWQNETLCRAGGRNQDHNLPLTHSINSIRMRAGNAICVQTGERKDLNLDRCVDEICIKKGLNFGRLFE